MSTSLTPSPARRRAFAPRWTSGATSSPTTVARGRRQGSTRRTSWSRSPARRRASAPRWTSTDTPSPTTAARGRRRTRWTRGAGWTPSPARRRASAPRWTSRYAVTYDGRTWSSPDEIDSGMPCGPSPARGRASAPRRTATAASSPTTADRGRHPTASTRGVDWTPCRARGRALRRGGQRRRRPRVQRPLVVGARQTRPEQGRAAQRLLPEGELLRRGGRVEQRPHLRRRLVVVARRIDAENVLDSVSCPTASFCAAVDGIGNVLTYDGRSWSAPRGVETGNDWLLFLPDGEFLRGGGRVRIRRHLRRHHVVVTRRDRRGEQPVLRLLPDSELLRAVDEYGTSSPTTAAVVVTRRDRHGERDLDSVSCPTASFCAAVDE